MSEEFSKPKPLGIIQVLWFNFRKFPYIILLCKNTECKALGVAYPYPHWDLTQDKCPCCNRQLVTQHELKTYLELSK